MAGVLGSSAVFLVPEELVCNTCVHAFQVVDEFTLALSTARFLVGSIGIATAPGKALVSRSNHGPGRIFRQLRRFFLRNPYGFPYDFVLQMVGCLVSHSYFNV